MNELRQKRKIVVDFNIEFPLDMEIEMMAGIVRDYIHLFRFTIIPAEVRMYPTDVRIVQQAISLASDLKDMKQ